MKKVQIAAGLLAFLLADVAAAPSCPGGRGYWDYEEMQVRVCDYVTETYTESFRHCGYNGWIQLSPSDSIWYPPVMGSSLFTTSSKVLAAASSCPASEYISRWQSYWYRDPKDGKTGYRMGTFSGSLQLISDRVDTQTKTRTVETNCRIETQTVQVWRCGDIP